MRSASRSHFRPVLFALACLTTPSLARAQEAAPSGDGPVCLGFAFGAWTPKLDWRAVGHAPPPTRAAEDSAPGGRDWAASPTDVPDDTSIVLYPRWWPAGVTVALPTRTPAPGDTIVGRAFALVPRGDIAAPMSRVRAWRVPCRPAAAR